MRIDMQHIATSCGAAALYGQVSPAGIVNRVMGMEPLV
jgi:hypothetical protein